MTEVREVPAEQRPTGFTQDELDWVPWVEPISAHEAKPQQRELLTGQRGRSPYFRLLARNPEVLAERSANDKEIFYARDGLSRTLREFAATVTSRYNGCEYCASVHSRFTSQLSGRGSDVQRILDEGVGARIDPEWDAVADFVAALSASPPRATAAQVEALRTNGLGDGEIHELVLAAASFAWANRMMLSLGEPEVAAKP